MSPHIHHGDSKFGILWRRWVGTVALVAVVIVGAIGFARVEMEGNTREKQFCGLVITAFQEQGKRIEQTKKFLDTPNSTLPQSLIDLKSYISHVSLPQTEKEFRSEEKNIPEVCQGYYEEGAQ